MPGRRTLLCSCLAYVSCMIYRTASAYCTRRFWDDVGRLNLVRMFLFTHRKPQPRSNPEQDAVEFVQPGFPGWARRSGTHGLWPKNLGK